MGVLINSFIIQVIIYFQVHADFTCLLANNGEIDITQRINKIRHLNISQTYKVRRQRNHTEAYRKIASHIRDYKYLVERMQRRYGKLVPPNYRGYSKRPSDPLPDARRQRPRIPQQAGKGGKAGRGNVGGRPGGQGGGRPGPRRTTIRRRSTPSRISVKEDCDYLAYYCLKAYNTGMLCGRTLYYNYLTFKNYCLLDYINCMETYELWQVVHMGPCMAIKPLKIYLHYPYQDDYFLDQEHVIENM